MNSSPTADRICQAAIRTATRDGILAMTLDNVAKEAGISKGGVMYHFPTKEQLISGMLQYFGSQLERVLTTRVANDPQPHGRWARAIIHCVFPEAEPDPDSGPLIGADDQLVSPQVMPQFLLAILAATVNNPGLIAPLKDFGTRLRTRLLNDSDDGLEQLLVWLAIDGLMLWQFVGLLEPGDPLFQQIGDALRRKVSPASAPPAAARPKKRRAPNTTSAASSANGRKRR